MPSSDQELSLPTESRPPTEAICRAACRWEDLVLQLDLARRRAADARGRGDIESVIGMECRADRLLIEISALFNSELPVQSGQSLLSVTLTAGRALYRQP